MKRTELLRTEYQLQAHPEGGWFAEVFRSEAKQGERPFMGSIYFLLDGPEISHLHQIDCEEIWYYHEGCGLKITLVEMNGMQAPVPCKAAASAGSPVVRTLFLGADASAGQKVMAVIPKGAIFAAENIDPAGYTFMSCATAPAFSYEGFRLVKKAELKELCGGLYSKACGGPDPAPDYETLEHLAFE